MIYESIALMRHGKAFIDKVSVVSGYLQIPSDWLMAVMWKESGIKTTALNPDGGASGLIQFMPSTLAQWNVTGAQLRAMTGVQQLDYVKKYFSAYRGKIKSYGDLYLITFFPIAVGKPLDWVLHTNTLSAEKIARVNKIIDINKDSQITVGEFYEYSLKGFTPSIKELLMKAKDLIGILILMLICTGALVFSVARIGGLA